MKYEIMTGILFELLAKKSVSATELSKKYGVTPRTIYRYIDDLSFAGVPVETIRGASGGFKIMDHFKLASSFLTKSEYDAVLSALTAIYGELPDEVMESAINKLKSTKRGVSSVDVKTGNLVIDAGAWCDSFSHKEKLLSINLAIDKSCLVKFGYHDRNGAVSERIVEPHTIIFKEGTWYFYAYCHTRQAFRFFKVGRVSGLTVLEETFTRRELPNKLPFEGWYENSTLTTVTLKVEKDALQGVEEWLGVENIKQKEDYFIATADLPDEQSLIGKILSLGNGVKVLAPLELKIKVKKAIDELKKIY